MFQIKKSNLLLLYCFLICSLFLGLFLGENSSGGARHDHNYLIEFIEDFSKNFFDGLENFLNNPGSIIHSPFFYIIVSMYNKFFSNLIEFKIFYIFLSSVIPLIFYKILKKKFIGNECYYFLFSLIIFLSPYFRSNAIWGLGDNLSLIFFALFLLQLNKILKISEINRSYYYAAIFIILASYVRYYYCIYYFIIIYFLIINNISKKDIFKILLFSFLISIPAIVYFIVIFKNYNFLNTLGNFGDLNYINVFFNICIIILFYLIIFLINSFKDFYNYYKKNYKNFFVIISFSFLILTIDFFSFELINVKNNLGGGIIVKIFNELGINHYFLIFPFTLSLLIIDYIFSGNRKYNYFILLIVVLSLPLKITFQKYLDPLFLLVFFGLIISERLNFIMNKHLINLKHVYIYFVLFLLSSNVYYSIYKI